MKKRTFQLFSDEVNIDETQTAFVDYLASLQHYFKEKRVYPDSHKAVKNSYAAHRAAAELILMQSKCIVLARFGDKLITYGTQMTVDDSRVNVFSEALEIHRVRKIRFWRGYTESEISRLCELLAQRSRQIQDGGGLRYLLENEGVKHIEVIIASALNEPNNDTFVDDMKSQNIPMNQKWMSGLARAGVDRRGFVDYFNFGVSENKLMQRELQLAAQVISTTPQAIAELVLFMAADPDCDDQIDAGRVFLALQRVENILLMHSAYENHKIRSMIYDATERFSMPLRLMLLHNALSQQGAKNWQSPGFRLFDFSFYEIFEVIMDKFAESGELPSLDFLLLDQRKLAQLSSFCRRRLNEEEQIPAEIMDEFMTCLEVAVKLNFRQIHHLALSTTEINTKEVERRLNQLQPELERGYLGVLISLLRNCADDPTREKDICRRMDSLMDLYFEKLDEETLLPVLTEFTLFPDERKPMLKENFFKHRLDPLAKLMKLFSVHYPREAADLLFQLKPFVSTDFLNKFILEGFFDTDTNIRAAAFELFLLRRDCLEEIFETLQSDDREYNRLLGFDLLSGIGTLEAEELIVRNFKQLTKLRRSGVVFILGRFSGDKSRELLVKLATDKRYRAGDLRRAAILVLGLRRDEGTEHLFYEIIKKRRFCRLYVGWRLRSVAAYALELSGTEEAQKLLTSALDNFRRTVIMVWRDALIAWLKRRLGVVWDWLAVRLNKVKIFLWRQIQYLIVFLRRRVRWLYKMIKGILNYIRYYCKLFLENLWRALGIILNKCRNKLSDYTRAVISFLHRVYKKSQRFIRWTKDSK
ncbi:MAG: hypothetical protein PHE87_04885 [Victivallaceae bacterium]|nr:hypothetical protein [Victivallaceae bacterium]